MSTALFPHGPASIEATPQIEIGRGARRVLADRCLRFGSTALVVTDEGIMAAGILDEVLDLLALGGVDTIVYQGVEANPTDRNVEAGIDAGTGRGVSVIVSVGGGSVHDCAKAVSLVAANGGRVGDYDGVDLASDPGIPVVAVNTTAGSGAEISRFAVITDTGTHRKMILADRHLSPLVAIEDPELTVSLPPAVTAASGMDALTHAVEAHVSTAANDWTRLCSRRAVELLWRHLPDAYRDPTDIEAREAVLYASLLAAVAFNSASVGAVHALAHQLGGLLGLVHGVCNALLLPVVSAYNADAEPARYADLASAFGLSARGLTGTKAVVAAMRRLATLVGIEGSLGELGVSPDHIESLTAMAMTDLCLKTNPRPLSRDEVADLYRRAL